MSAKSAFIADLAKSSEAVKSWPSWKQTVWDIRCSPSGEPIRNEYPQKRNNDAICDSNRTKIG